MARVGANPETSSNKLEQMMLPDVEETKAEGGADIDLAGDGVHKVYLHRGQLDIYNWQARTTYIRAARGFGKTSYIGLHMMKCVLGLRRQMGGFVGSSAKQLYTRTMPNALKVVNTLGFEKFYFMGQPPAKLRWEMPLARPRVWENCVSFANGFVWQMLSMAVRGSANGLNLAALVGDETKYLPWQRVKEEVMPTLRGDFMPASARKVEKKNMWGYGTVGAQNPFWLSSLWVSDAGLTNAQCLWEQDGREQESRDVNSKIAEMLAELAYLQKHNRPLALQLAQNDNYLRQLNALRSESSVFWNWSSLENLSMLGQNFIRDLERQLPRMMFEIQVLGRMIRNAGDGFYSQFTEELNTYESQDCTDLILDKYSHKAKGRFLDVQRYPTDVEYMTLDLDELKAAGEDCSCDLDVQYDQPLRIAIDCGHDMNCMVVGQTTTYQGRPSVFVMKEFFVQGDARLRSLVRMFTNYYRPHLRRRHSGNEYGGGAGEVIYYYNQTSKQGGATAYAVESSEDSRFDNVVVRELESYGWKVTRGEFSVWRHERKWQLFCDIFSFQTSPSVYISRESGRCQYLLVAITQAGVLPGFKKDKTREKLKSNDPESLGGDPRTRTDITDAFDDLIIGIKEGAEGNRKIGGGLRNKFQHLAGIPH